MCFRKGVCVRIKEVNREKKQLDSNHEDEQVAKSSWQIEKTRDKTFELVLGGP